MIENDYNGEEYYNSYLYGAESPIKKFNDEYFSKLASEFKHFDNSNYCVLDLQGGDGYWGLKIAKILNAKKSICTDFTKSMIDMGSKKYSSEKIEFYNLGFEESLTDERILKEKYCAIIIKEAIHFSNPGYAQKLYNFLNNNCSENFFLSCNGLIRTKHWKTVPDVFPKPFMDYLNLHPNDSWDFAEEMKKISGEKDLIIKKELHELLYEFPFEAFKYFLEKRCWSGFNLCSDEEIQTAINKQKNDSGIVRYTFGNCYVVITKNQG